MTFEQWKKNYPLLGTITQPDKIAKDAWDAAKTAAREQLAAWMTAHSFSTGHGDSFEDLLKELTWQIEELRTKAT